MLAGANKIYILSKTTDSEYTGALIDNESINQDIKANKTITEHVLSPVNPADFSQYTNGHTQGTIIVFDGITNGIKHTPEFFKKVIALYFRFALIDSSFKIFLNNEEITAENDLADLIHHTQILWKINELKDPFAQQIENRIRQYEDNVNKIINIKADEIVINEDGVNSNVSVYGFIASMAHVSKAKDDTLGEKLSVDLFVNGRLREKDILRHIPKNRVYENYVYGQIYFDGLDDAIDRFTSSREGVAANDPLFARLLEILNDQIMSQVAKDWDKIRLALRQSGDTQSKDGPTPRQRAIRDAITETRKEFVRDDIENDAKEDKLRKKNLKYHLDMISDDADMNTEAYVDCFFAENILRKYILENSVDLSKEIKKHTVSDGKDGNGNQKYKEVEIDIRSFIDMRKKEEESRITENGLNTDIRMGELLDLSFLELRDLAKIIDPTKGGKNGTITAKSKLYHPLRNAVMHTALLTDRAKNKLKDVREDIVWRLNKIKLSSPKKK